MAAGADIAWIVFWTSILTVLYTYAGYPLIVGLLAWLWNKPVHRDGIELPPVLVLLVVHNEEKRVGARLLNLLASDYPPQRLRIVVALDGCTDQTAAAVEQVMERQGDGPQMQLQSFPERRGKATIINQVLEAALEPIVMFCDVRQRYEPQTIRRLMESFADPQVGAVSGELHLVPGGDSAVSTGLRLYWWYEKLLRKAESRIHSTLGATGAIYALRRSLFRPIPPDTMVDDLIIPLQVVAQGRRVVYDIRAKAYDGIAKTPAIELARKVRTLTGSFQCFVLLRHLFLPWRSPVAWQLASHKVLRVLVPYMLLAALLSSAALSGQLLYRGLLLAQVLFYGLGVVGALAPRQVSRLGPVRLAFQVPHFFLLLNLAAAVAAGAYALGSYTGAWKSAPSEAFSSLDESSGQGAARPNG